jgi:hypothetical protein
MGTAMFGRAVTVCRVEITFRGLAVEFSFQRKILGGGPIQSLGGKVVCEVNPFAAREWVRGSAGAGQSQQKKKTQASDTGSFHVCKIVNLWDKDKCGGANKVETANGR